MFHYTSTWLSGVHSPEKLGSNLALVQLGICHMLSLYGLLVMPFCWHSIVCVQNKGNPLEASIVAACCGILANMSNAEVHDVATSLHACSDMNVM